MPTLFTSLIRTVVPIVAGLVLSAAARIGLDVDGATVTSTVTAAITAAYYTAFRLLEEVADRLDRPLLRRIAGAFLGWAQPPQYSAGEGRGRA